MKERETLGSRLGFILLSAGCAIGLGNVYRFPFIVGQYGGAAFIILYMIFLVILGIPILTMEFAVGRGSRKSIIESFKVLEKPGKKWHLFGYFGAAGNYLLMMFYTTIAGWMIAYLIKFINGEFHAGQSVAEVGQVFTNMQADPLESVLCMAAIVLLGFLICSIGLQKGVERITKIMMAGLFIIMIALVIRALTLDGAGRGLEFYLVPDFKRLAENGIGNAIFAAMGQAFFTLSIGMGSMAIFGSYIGKERRLMGEAVNVTILDTLVAVMAGLIIFPACFSYGVQPDAGPPLIFITLPNIFNNMPGGAIWGCAFFLFLIFAALSTVIAVFENIMSICMDKWGWSRKKASIINVTVLIALSLPVALGGSVFSGVHILFPGNGFLNLFDFIVSNNILPLGSVVYVLFCTMKNGWGYDNFIAEVNCGKGIVFPSKLKFYTGVILPLIILVIFVQGYLSVFAG